MLLLDPVSIPLNQNALIEASAGTGKTYTITTLYLRAILGLVENNETLTPKSIDQVLVVTFTEAATLEIKERVRLKLREAQQSLLRISEDVSGEGIDKNMYALFMLFKKAYLKSVNESDTSYETNNWCLAAYKRLQDALLLIDEASIFTIHGFCQRCLTQFAFETKSSFEQEFEMDAGPIWQQAVYDLWRRFVSPLTGSEFDWFRSYWADPKALFAELAPLVGKQVKLSPEIEEAEYQGLLSRFERLVRQLKHDWRQQEFSSCLSNSGLKKNTKIIKRLTKVEEFLSGDDWLADIDKDMGWYLYGSSSLQDTKNYKANSEFVNHEIIKIVDELAQVEEKLKLGCFKSYWLGLSRQYIEIKAHSIKEEQGIINPDDLLTELAAAVSSADGGLLLLEAIRRRYPLAFIDEFQDTDPIQYCIFETIYGEGRSDETTGNNGNGKPESADDEKSDANMLLIGDPKQAIYKFRGADIFTYIRAKEDLSSEQHYTLATNYRSHPKLIESVNTIFEKSELGFEHKQIPFLPVLAGKSEQNALVDTQKQAPLLDIFHLNAIDDDGEALSGFKSTDGERLIANWCVADIKSCLYGENYHSIKKGDNKERLTPGDICILVRNRNQAKIIKEQLAAQGLASVYLSRDSVFSSDLALDLYRLLKAVHTPNNEHYVRAALLTRIFAYDTQESLKLQREPELWQQHLVWFFQANELWQKGSIAAAIDTLLLNADTFSKWQHLYPQLVNRMVTDIRHLIELLQQQANKHSGVEKLFFWFEKQITQMGSWQEPGKEQQLRLESDSQLIQIATLHASKGLEYPVVYLPFISELKPAKSALYTSQSGDKSLTYRVDNRLLERQIAEQERLAEDIRLLYVAMTRPVYRLVVGLFNLTDAYKRPVFSQTGIGRLLLGEKTAKPTDGDIENVCRNLLALDGTSSNSQNRYLSMSATEVQTGYMQAESIQVPEQKSKQINLRARSFLAEVNTGWKMLSYSALAGAGHDVYTSKHVSLREPKANDEFIDEVSGLTDESSLTSSAKYHVESDELIVPSQFSFPKGANAGTCLHWFFETLDFQIPVVLQSDVILEGLQRYGFDAAWANVLTNWLQTCLDRDLGGLRLSQLPSNNRIVEMEFYFDFSHLSAQVLNNALRMMGVKSRLNLHSDLINNTNGGVIKGFIDLTFCHQNKYYVLDYKSNFLGDSAEDYQMLNLEEAMTDHNYHLQALVYILALHRFLQSRIDSYEFDTHIGGAIYYFLRGVNKQEDSFLNSGVYHHKINKQTIEYLDNALRNVVDENQQMVTGAAKLRKQNNETADNTEQMGFNFDEC